MYSKEKGMTRPGLPHRPLSERVPAYRQPPRERLQVPPNYSGHAIVDGEERPLGSLSAPEPEPPRPADPHAPGEPTPRFDTLPRVSELGDPHRHQPRTLSASFAVNEPHPEDEEGEAPSAAPGTGDPAPTPAVIPTAAPPAGHPGQPSRGLSLFGGGFPFGHGLGIEELLLLGLILFLLRECGEGEERGDLDETVILLGLLLLLG